MQNNLYIAKSSVSTILNASINNQNLDEAVLADLVEAAIAIVLAATTINKSKEEGGVELPCRLPKNNGFDVSSSKSMVDTSGLPNAQFFSSSVWLSKANYFVKKSTDLLPLLKNLYKL